MMREDKMKKKKFVLFPIPILSIILLLTWLMLNNTISVGHIVLGSILSILIPLHTSRFWPEKVCIGKWSTVFKLSMVVGYDIIISNIFVAKLNGKQKSCSMRYGDFMIIEGCGI